MRIVTSNVNGVRAAHRKGFIEWIERTDPDVLLLQETRAPEDIIEEIIGKSYQVFSSVSTLKGRAGVAIAVKNAYSATFETDLLGNMEDQKDVDTGRWLEVYLHDYDLRIVSAYLHAGNEKMEEKMTAKYQHLTKVDARLKELRGTSLIMGGDFNVVRSEYDIKNWKNNHNKTAGVLDEEIVYLERWFTEYEYVDVTRKILGEKVQAPYTWWSQRGQAFANDTGWRIDYQLVSDNIAQKVQGMYVDRAPSRDDRFSDHAPLVVDYEM